MEPDTDNLMPKSGQYFGIPQEDQDLISERQTESAKVFNALPLIQEILDRFEERIAFYSSVDSIPEEIHTKPDEFMHAVAANKLAKDNLISEKEYLEGLLDDNDLR